MACLGGCFAAAGRFSGWDSLVLDRRRNNGWIPRGWRARATDRSSSPLWRIAERTGLSLLQWRERVLWELPLLFFIFFFLHEGTNQRNFFLHGSSSHAVASVRLRVDFLLLRKSFCAPTGFTPRFLFFLLILLFKVGWIWTESQRQREHRRPATWPPRFIYREPQTAAEKL